MSNKPARESAELTGNENMKEYREDKTPVDKLI